MLRNSDCFIKRLLKYKYIYSYAIWTSIYSVLSVPGWVELPNNSYKPINNTAWVIARLCKLQKRVHSTCNASDQVYQMLAHGRWLSPGNPASSATKTGRHDIADILLKVALNTINQIKSNTVFLPWLYN